MDFLLGHHGPKAAFVSGLTTEFLQLGGLLGCAVVAGPSLDGGLDELRELRLTRSSSKLRRCINWRISSWQAGTVSGSSLGSLLTGAGVVRRSTGSVWSVQRGGGLW
jgi:hypothetical protein